jgi:hypothetical protein
VPWAGQNKCLPVGKFFCTGAACGGSNVLAKMGDEEDGTMWRVYETSGALANNIEMKLKHF